MAEQNGKQTTKGITGITISGFKSLRDESHIDVRPLTILAGANSSGKSSIMQPLLLMKQTLEAPFDPGVFLLNGPNVRFTDIDQFFAKTAIEIKLDIYNRQSLSTTYRRGFEFSDEAMRIEEMVYQNTNTTVFLRQEMTNEEIVKQFQPELENLRLATENISKFEYRWHVIRNKCFFNIGLITALAENRFANVDFGGISFKQLPVGDFTRHIYHLIHIPGLRGNPERLYSRTSISGSDFPGTFENYTAMVLYAIQGNLNILNSLNKNLHLLGLTSIAYAMPTNDAQIELRVGRTLRSDRNDLVNIADVGFGVSQVLPVLVALLVAEPGQLVYIEQPELHLHPRAQVALAQVLADAANRGVKVVAETHSTLLIQGIQTLIAEQKLDHKDVIFHWFKRGEDGVTQITSQEPDAFGAYGDWPEDFADVQFEADNTYLEAVEKRRAEELHDGQEPEMSGD